MDCWVQFALPIKDGMCTLHPKLYVWWPEKEKQKQEVVGTGRHFVKSSLFQFSSPCLLAFHGSYLWDNWWAKSSRQQELLPENTYTQTTGSYIQTQKCMYRNTYNFIYNIYVYMYIIISMAIYIIFALWERKKTLKRVASTQRWRSVSFFLMNSMPCMVF